MAALNVNKGEEVKLTANEFTFDYYVFTGWNTAADGSGTPYKDEATVKFDKDTTLYAQWWQPKVTFKENGATSGTMPAQSVGYNTATKLSSNVFKRTEYVFLGWNTKADGSGQAYTDQQSVTLTTNLELYAQWAIDLSTTTLSKTSWGGTNGNIYTLSSAETDISERITVTGSVKLLLPAGVTLNAQKGITVSGTNSLTIDGTGTLNATGTSFSAGIGGFYNGGRDAGTIIISGGIVNATGGDAATGIGGATYGACGNITITGGTVTAEGDGWSGQANFAGAGIGSGAGYNSKAIGTVTITGGTVTAIGNYGGAGIGGGSCASDPGGEGITVIITGGTVSAIKGKGNAGGDGIGHGNGGNSNRGTLTVDSTTMNVYGDNNINPPTTLRNNFETTRYTYMKVEPKSI